MRVKRVEKFRRQRNRKSRRIILFAVVLPVISVITGYILTYIAVLPVMAK